MNTSNLRPKYPWGGGGYPQEMSPDKKEDVTPRNIKSPLRREGFSYNFDSN
jgi:hypothetical protein